MEEQHEPYCELTLLVPVSVMAAHNIKMSLIGGTPEVEFFNMLISAADRSITENECKLEGKIKLVRIDFQP